MPGYRSAIPRNLSADVKIEFRFEKDNMAYAMWGIVLGLMLLIGASLRRYRRRLLRKRETRWLDEHHVIERLRKQLGR
jgi:hypothetical protein